MIKEYNDSTWQSKAYSKIVDTTQQVISFPVVVRPMENTIPSWTIKGNMSQTGTPTSTTPIQPSECGEETANLLNTAGAQSGYISENGSITQGHDNLMYTDYIPIPDSAEYITQSATYTMLSPAMCFYDGNKDFISGEAFRSASTKTFDIPNNAKYIRTSYRTGSSFGKTMLNTGSTVLPYEPYGIKILISSANTTTPVCLGEVESTRRVKKYVFDGTESWVVGNYPKPDSYQFYIAKNVYFPDAKSTIASGDSFCTHFLNRERAGGTAWGINFNIYMLISDLPENATADDFKAFLAAQYAAGTPVTLWYPLATETTGIVNEPLRKIGDYTDTVSGTNLSVTAQSPTTIDVNTSLKPSEMDLTYIGKKMCKRKKRVNGAWV